MIKPISNDRSLRISTLSSREYAEAGGGFASDRGYFLYERDDGAADAGIEILAKVADREAAYRLADLWGFSQPTAPC